VKIINNKVKGCECRMMADEKEKWSFCGVCRRNHDGGRKHIFSSHHKAKLATLLAKFSKKVSSLAWNIRPNTGTGGVNEQGGICWVTKSQQSCETAD
jgi:hypothetical protein